MDDEQPSFVSVGHAVNEWCLLPNFGGEEVLAPPLTDPIYDRLALLWGLLFDPVPTWGGDPSTSEQIAVMWQETVDGGSLRAVGQSGSAWFLNQSAAEQLAAKGNVWGPAWSAVARCHDKAFVRREAHSPDVLHDCCEFFSPEDLQSESAFIDRLTERLSVWPDCWRKDWTLKPRFGSSGRGRYAGVGLGVDSPTLRGSLVRFRRQGGVVLEPFVRRRRDFSVQLMVPAEPDRPPEILGSLRPLSSLSGSYQGHQGNVTFSGVCTGHPKEEELRRVALEFARQARELGFWGPCGLDAFVYRHEGKEYLHVCEWNARWTVGHVVHGLIRRLRSISSLLQPIPFSFEFRLDGTELSNGRVLPVTVRDGRVTSFLKLEKTLRPMERDAI